MLFFSIALCAFASSDDPSRLWLVVQSCVAAEEKIGIPLPCLKVNLRGGTIVLRAPFERTHLLLVPTTKISGLESPMLRSEGDGIYWKAAVDARSILMDQLAGRQVEAVGFAVNSQASRSQDQFHIHIDCVKPEVRRTLLRESASFEDRWSRLPFYLEGQHYYGRKIAEADLAGANLVGSLMNDVASLRNAPSAVTIGLIALHPTNTEPDFYAVANLAYASGQGAEILLDHHCSDR